MLYEQKFNSNKSFGSFNDLISPENDNENYENIENEEKFINRKKSFRNKQTAKVSFFSPHLKKLRYTICKVYFKYYILMAVFILGIFSIYWGSMYRRDTRTKNFDMLIVIEDDREINNIPPLIGNQLRELMETPSAKNLGKWNIFNSSDFTEKAQLHNNTIEKEVIREIHHQKYWSSIYVKPNATFELYNAISQGKSDYNVSNSSIVSIYETGRDILSMSQYVQANVQSIERLWLSNLNKIIIKLLDILNNKTEVMANEEALQILTTPINFTYYDMIPNDDPVTYALFQVGLIFMFIVTLFLFNFFGEINKTVGLLNLKKSHYMLYRYFATILTYLYLSLFFCLLSLAMQVDFTKAFGKSGFLVYWMVNFITMTAIGLINEIMAMLSILVDPPLMGFWLLFWVVINITPTFAPLVLSSKFFRYGYGIPIHNAYEIDKVIVFDTWKGILGRSFGVLIAWIGLGSILYPFVINFFNKTMKKRIFATIQTSDAH